MRCECFDCGHAPCRCPVVFDELPGAEGRLNKLLNELSVDLHTFMEHQFGVLAVRQISPSDLRILRSILSGFERAVIVSVRSEMLAQGIEKNRRIVAETLVAALRAAEVSGSEAGPREEKEGS